MQRYESNKNKEGVYLKNVIWISLDKKIT